MKKLLAGLVALSLIALPALAKSTTKAKVYTLKIGHASTTDSTRHKGLLAFKKYVEDKSDGRIKVEIYPAGSLGTEGDMIESMKMGTLEGFVGGVFDAQTPKLNLILMPFFFPTQADLMKVAHSDIGAEIMKSAEQNGIKMLAFGDGGSRQITNNVRPVHSPADMKGLKIRTPPIESIIKCMSALGANPVSVAYADTYMALKTGVADGEENPVANIGDMKFYEVQKYMTYIDYQFHPEPVDFCLSWYNSLPADLQKVLQDAAWVYTDTQNELRLKMNDTYYNTIEKAGVQIYKPTETERQEFVKACQPVYDYFVKQGIVTNDELNQMRKIVSSK